ncbi:hypothetical protein TNCV_2035791 [Trichonephila clavipes]|nr:hypothetical protein TNCV_2035791 [Trichonephila clavipes]
MTTAMQICLQEQEALHSKEKVAGVCYTLTFSVAMCQFRCLIAKPCILRRIRVPQCGKVSVGSRWKNRRIFGDLQRLKSLCRNSSTGDVKSCQQRSHLCEIVVA